MSENKVKNEENKMTSKIMDGLKGVEPKSKNYFAFRNVLLGFGLGTFLAISILAVAVFLYDFNEIKEVYNSAHQDLSFKEIAGLLFEFLFIGVLGGALIYYIYRKTDWILVKYKSLVAFLTSIFILTGGLFLFLFLQDNESDDNVLNVTRRGLEALPYRKDRVEDIIDQLSDKDVFIGRIVAFDDQKNEITVKNFDYQKTFLLKPNQIIILDKIDPTKPVFIKFKRTSDGLLVERIENAKVPEKFQRPGQINGEIMLKPRLKGVLGE